MKKLFFTVFFLSFFAGCSEEPKSKDFYLNNSEALEAKLKECGAVYRDNAGDKGWRFPERNPNREGFSNTEVCLNARMAIRELGLDVTWEGEQRAKQAEQRANQLLGEPLPD